MPIAPTMLNEFQAESKSVRQFLERVPEDRLAWRPHPKSMSLGQLALHIATAPGGVIEMASRDESPLPDFSGGMPEPRSVGEIIAAFEKSVAKVESTLPLLDDARMRQTWSATANGEVVFSTPRVGFLRNILLNHWYHHRGQLSVYLRLLDVAVPSSYGPTADEVPEFARA